MRRLILTALVLLSTTAQAQDNGVTFIWVGSGSLWKATVFAAWNDPMEQHGRTQAFCPKMAQVGREVTRHVAKRQSFPSYTADQMTFRCYKNMPGWKFKQLVESHNAEVEDARRELDKTERCLARIDLATVDWNNVEPCT